MHEMVNNFEFYDLKKVCSTKTRSSMRKVGKTNENLSQSLSVPNLRISAHNLMEMPRVSLRISTQMLILLIFHLFID